MATPGPLTARTSGRDRDRRVALAIVTSAFSAMLLAAVATTLFTAVTTFALVTSVGALIIATWHLRNHASTPSHTVPDEGRTGQPVRSSR